MIHGGGYIIHGSIKYSTEVVKKFAEVSNIRWRGLDDSRRGQTCHRGAQKIHGDMKYVTEELQKFTEVSNIPWGGEIIHGGIKHSMEGVT